MGLKKIPLTLSEKESLEKITGLEIYLRNNFEENQHSINGLIDQAKQNALIYLERNQLGQKLSIFEENNLFSSVLDLQAKLGLKQIPRRIECYDISHLSGTFVYGSMVVFIDGRPAKNLYRLFKTKWQNNDFENHKNVLDRRFKRCLEWQLNPDNKDKENTWMLPDLIIVDGGKGQLSGDLEIFDNYRQQFTQAGLEFNVEVCSLAKREEELFLPHNPESVRVTGQTLFLIQRIRDEAHRFAITNNRKARLKTASKSQLDDIKGVGEKTKLKLLQVFGSTEKVISSLYSNPEMLYDLVGENIVNKLRKHFGIVN
jgi:excinuclease ABC subunit C